MAGPSYHGRLSGWIRFQARAVSGVIPFLPMNSRNSHSVLRPPIPESAGRALAWQAPPGASLALAVHAAARRHRGLVVLVCADTHQANEHEQDLRALGTPDDVPVRHFPDWETLPYDRLSPHPDCVSQRLAALNGLPRMNRGILVVPAGTLLQRLPPREYVTGRSLVLDTGQALSLEPMRRDLEAAGYYCVSEVHDPGEFAVRGNILDLYPMGSQAPYRIELFDEEVESIRTFDPETQRTRERVESVRLLPGREYPFDQASRRDFRQRLRSRFTFDPRECELYSQVKDGIAPAGIEYYLPLFFESTGTLFDYLPSDSLFLGFRDAHAAARHFWDQAWNRYEQRRHDQRHPVLPPGELFLAPDEADNRVSNYRKIDLYLSDNSPDSSETFLAEPTPSLPIHSRGSEPAASLKRFLATFEGRVLFAADSPGRREALQEVLGDLGMHPAPVDGWHGFLSGRRSPAITVAPLESGFRLGEPAVAVITETELFGERAQQRRRRSRTQRDHASVIRDLTDLRPGAPVVHEDHGVGRYRGLDRLSVGGRDGEFLAIEYADGDRLYVPVGHLHLVSRYTGASEEGAPLHRLGGEQWQRVRRKAAEKIRDVAAELLEVQARREARRREPVKLDEPLYQDFAATFPFEETPDQKAAIEQVLADLQSSRPMDRVVCGDVGFGKTEVALRAAFAVAQAGRQAAVLVPTTLLAGQHFETFRDRFADWPVRVEMLSRFRAGKATRQVIAGLEDGTVDIVIGTHRLLQQGVKFKNLGLVIVDEEQRFGVRQKERLKSLRAEVDLLTLTATPIPRTLNMSLSGLRDLSLIATAPASRLAIKTFVQQWDGAAVREACLREIQRGGQVYFLHNDVQSIQRIARELEELVPEARVRVAHGQMPERQLEQVMLDFYRQRFNVLVCTTIIENGIDIPSANTIVMNRADKLGLAQLHQLRGRVGRSHHRAYAYLIVPERRAMTADALKRVEAVASLEELGSGFTLATHDLEIRGAGEVLGEDQSGQIEEIGFSLYNDLLERAVSALKAGEIPDLDAPVSAANDVDLHIPALIPDDYLPDVHTRLILYKRIASAKSDAALRELQVEMIDRFGLLPQPVKNLFAVASLRLHASRLGITRLEFGEHGGRIEFGKNPAVDPAALIQLVQERPDRFAFDGETRLRVNADYPEASQRLAAAEELLDRLALREAA